MFDATPSKPRRTGRSKAPVRSALFVALLASLACLFLAACRDEPVAPTTQETVAEDPSVVRGQARRELEYEVRRTDGLEEMTRLADVAIIETLRKKNLPDQALQIEDVRMQSARGENFHFQVLRLDRNQTFDAFLDALRISLASRMPTAVLHQSPAGEAYILFDDIPTHKILPGQAPREPQRPTEDDAEPGSPSALMAIVIDDLGEDAAFARALARLPVHVSFSVWPRASHTSQVVDIAKKYDRDLLVHQPMEPKGYPKVAPGPGALLVDMTREEIEQAIDDSLAKVPGAVGMNNHMGSSFTEWGPGMKVVMQRIRDNDLFFLDSLTTPKSAGLRQSQMCDALFCRRNIFLDNVAETRAILHQLKKAQRLAERSGRAIAIGHPHPETLEALSIWAQGLPPSVQVVGVRRLARKSPAQP